MELGNMIFGNSRGEAEIPRESEWEDPLFALLEACGSGDRGYPPFENAVFKVAGYDWDAECDCGASDQRDRWEAEHKHAWFCYQTELTERMKRYEIESGYDAINKAAFGADDSVFSGFDTEHSTDNIEGVVVHGMVMHPRKDRAMEAWRSARKKREKFEKKLFDELCAKHGVDREYGAAVHCTCGHDDGYAAFAAAHPHADTCRLIQPNFLHKPSGFRVNWYKYPLRDSYMTPPIDSSQWAKIMAECVSSLAHPKR